MAPTPIPRLGFKSQNSILSDHGQVPYQIKGNDEATWKDIFCPYAHFQQCSNIAEHILSLPTPSTPEVGSKGKTFFFL